MIYKKSKQMLNKIRLNKRIFVDLYSLATRLEFSLRQQGISFSKEGFPIIPKEMLIHEVPDDIEMFPLSKRHEANQPKCTILCAYENDSNLYRFLRHLERNIPSDVH